MSLLNKLIMQTPQEKKFLEILDQSLSPFQNFVAKLDIEEKLPLMKDRDYILHKLINIINKRDYFKIIPITGKTGMGKTFMCWEIKKNLLIEGTPIFFEVPADSKMFYYDLYTKFVEEIGAEKLRQITTKISDRWGAGEIKFGLFRTSNTAKVLERAKTTPRFRWNKHKEELEDCLKAVIIHSIDPEKSPVAERWLLGDRIEPEELYYLGIERNLTDNNVAEQLLKLICSYLENGIILIYDDFDKNWEKYSSDDYDDDDWANTLDPDDENFNEQESDTPEPTSNAVEFTFFDELAKIINEIPQLRIVLSMDTQSLEDIVSKFPKTVQEFISIAIPLTNFSSKDTKNYYKISMNEFCKKNDIDSIKSNPYFPLTEKLILNIFHKTDGNPRDLIRKFQNIFDEIIFDGLTIEDLEKE